MSEHLNWERKRGGARPAYVAEIDGEETEYALEIRQRNLREAYGTGVDLPTWAVVLRRTKERPSGQQLQEDVVLDVCLERRSARNLVEKIVQVVWKQPQAEDLYRRGQDASVFPENSYEEVAE